MMKSALLAVAMLSYSQAKHNKHHMPSFAADVLAPKVTQAPQVIKIPLDVNVDTERDSNKTLYNANFTFGTNAA